MRRRRLCIAVLLGAALIQAASVGVAAQGAKVLTLAQAVDEALAKNDRLINQHDTTTQADLGLRLARNTFQPKVTPNIFGSFGRTDISSQTYRVDVSQKLVTGTELRLNVGTRVGADSGHARRTGQRRAVLQRRHHAHGVAAAAARLRARRWRGEALTSAEAAARRRRIASRRSPNSRSRSMSPPRTTASCRSRRLSTWPGRACSARAGCATRPRPSSTPASCRSSTCCARNSSWRRPRFSCSTRNRRSKTRAISCRS